MMGDWWTPETMPDPSLDTKELSSISGISMCPSRPKSSYSVLSAFCTEDNVPQCIAYVNQEVCSLGVSAVCVECVSGGLSAVPVLNVLYELLQLQRRAQRTHHELENQLMKNTSDLEHLQHSHCRLKDQLEHTRRENSGLHEGERQLQLKIRTLQNCLKSEKEEVQKLQSIISSRATQYSHDAKRKERESSKLKERLNQLLVDKRDKKLAIEVSNCVGRPDGRRGLWKTGKMEARHEGEMYRALLSDYEARQRSLMMENVELQKVLQHMKKDMMAILSPKSLSVEPQPPEDSLEQAVSSGEDEDEDEEGSRGPLEQSCEQAREQLTNSIRLQWRKLKSHMQRLDSQVSLVACQEREAEELMSRKDHEEEMQRIRLELQQCKEFIHMQQQLLQQQLSVPCDEETAALLNDCYTLEEKERLKEEWRLFAEQKRNFERERRNFTEAAIRLGHERKSFEEDRATWLKTQFLNMTPFVDRKRPALPDPHTALSVSAGPEAKLQSTPPLQTRPLSYSAFSTPKSVRMPSTADLYRTLHLIPDSRGQGKCPSAEMLSKARLRSCSSTDCSVISLRDEDSPM
ncbi:synovial sarcoma, X breakpoint 2 interacting protein a isoform X1 [Pimephales promelas]|uniref:synovial sarcoma, X breakpoint 2 interacting protein a isoform X1 n=1 Tax=Pimephales promelas TaxID=90988 RepID=UPI001955503C|nr:synovial sarcoma, X breakpoint 2 interacting protein a isoform X1 [Pimephales promelas]XP_039530453.1 synovial sarcoma, X breakpoint 2 interacting protein a isoform X1 [Pimephales promelas]XP_039530454.1 synovial sarcoma, X breakpoint 2 interacting protein a isoform X1 [Pimephales promelas]XP_039530455.1 synovial sarcoma, X breakpoint 2 interacting protein a isoform X1 [Pimephales promelas]KAG1926645.1 afadin- and alpha-actinin-binding protein [Pimephales promelas]KAG1926646.1 afadin- and a